MRQRRPCVSGGFLQTVFLIAEVEVDILATLEPLHPMNVSLYLEVPRRFL